MRYALISSHDAAIAAYLPSDYGVLHRGIDPDTGGKVTVIGGRDFAGWSLDDYVLPRLASGLYHGKEIDLSHPIMKEVPQ